MALTPCPECGNEVSTAATACPSCGHPIERNATEPSATLPAPGKSRQIDPVAKGRSCATPGCENTRGDGNFCSKHSQASGNADEVTTKQGCFGCLGVIGVILVIAMAWTVGGAVVDWVTGANDPNNEGSTAWCRKNGISEEQCGPLNSLAKGRDMTPSEYLASMESVDEPTSVVSDSDLLVAAVRLTVSPLYPAIDVVSDATILTLARETCTLVNTSVAQGLSPDDALALVVLAVIGSDLSDVGAVLAGATLGAMETTTCSQHGGYIRQMLNAASG